MKNNKIMNRIKKIEINFNLIPKQYRIKVTMKLLIKVKIYFQINKLRK